MKDDARGTGEEVDPAKDKHITADAPLRLIEVCPECVCCTERSICEHCGAEV